MKDLKILVLGKNDELKIHSAPHYRREELAKLAHVDCYGLGWGHPDINQGGKRSRNIEDDILKLIPVFKPDIIYIVRYLRWKNLDKIDIPVAYAWGDTHAYIKRRVEQINKHKIDMTIHSYVGKPPLRSMENLKPLFFEGHKMEWVPHSVNLNVFKDYDYDRIYDIAVLGKSSKSVYPLRWELRRGLGIGGDRIPTKEFSFFFKKRPKRSWGWGDKKLKRLDVIAREGFAQAISRCKVMPVGSSVYKYALAKFFEVMATNTLVISDAPASAELLHFKAGYNYVEANRDNLMEKIRYYVDNESERNKIAKRGYDTVRKYHSCKIRAKQLLDSLEKLL